MNRKTILIPLAASIMMISGPAVAKGQETRYEHCDRTGQPWRLAWTLCWWLGQLGYGCQPEGV